MRKILFRGKRRDGEGWIQGDLVQHGHKVFIDDHMMNNARVEPCTVGQYTGLNDANGKMIFEGDIVTLFVEECERRFVVAWDTVQRTVVSHSNFDDPTARVYITGVIFAWDIYELFPCVDENGLSDVERMIVVGNKWDDGELLLSGGR